ncbi:membrane protease subunit, stomatin/prohibitin [Candidatus Magnetoovum chiemensis]|nr:membrane protease subunit, stomatin/prohibitin [Candidatus Magnetoovum chiemensis]
MLNGGDMDNDMFGDLKPLRVKGQKGALFIIIVLIAVIVIIALNPFVTIGAGERGVVSNFGAVQPKVFGEGLHFIIPIMQTVVKIDVQVQKSQTEASASSKDLQVVNSTIAINYHINPDKANEVYQTIGRQFKERIIDPAVQEVVKAVTARFTAEALITERPVVSQQMKESLSTRLLNHNMIVDEFSIVNFTFSSLFMEAIESKQTAEQLALKAKRDLDRVRIEAEQKIAQANAEAEALRVQKENITPELIELRKIEATLKAIDKWDGILPKVTSGAMPLIDLKDVR